MVLFHYLKFFLRFAQVKKCLDNLYIYIYFLNILAGRIGSGTLKAA